MYTKQARAALVAHAISLRRHQYVGHWVLAAHGWRDQCPTSTRFG